MSPDKSEGLEADSQQDREYFLRHPSQKHYLRPVSQAERVDAASQGKTIEPNAQMLVYKVDEATRFRLVVDSETSLDEALSKARATISEIDSRLAAKNKKGQKRPKAKGFQ
jgi:hypothetical protein